MLKMWIQRHSLIFTQLANLSYVQGWKQEPAFG